MQDALALAERRLHRVGEPASCRSGLSTSRSTTTSMLCLVFLSRVMRLLEAADLAVDARPGEAALLRVRQHVAVLALALLHQRSEQHQLASPPASGGSPRRSAGPTAGPPGGRTSSSAARRWRRRARAGSRGPRSPCPRWSAGCCSPPSARWRWWARAPGASRTSASPSARGTAGRRPRGSRRSAAVPRRRGCRRPASSCPLPLTPVKTTSVFLGTSSETDLRLCSAAPRMEMTSGSDMRGQAC